MGNKHDKPPSAPNKAVRDPRNEPNDFGDDEPRDESEPFLDLKIFYEMPGGTTRQLNLTTNPRRLVSDFKNDLSIHLNIPAQNIQIYRHSHPRTEMPNNSTLYDLNVTDEMQLRLRDSRHKYNKPITVN